MEYFKPSFRKLKYKEIVNYTCSFPLQLREEILKYGMYDNGGKLSMNSVKNMRLVQHCWLQTLTRLLQKLKVPVVALTFDGNAKDVKGKLNR